MGIVIKTLDTASTTVRTQTLASVLVTLNRQELNQTTAYKTIATTPPKTAATAAPTLAAPPVAGGPLYAGGDAPPVGEAAEVALLGP